MMIEMYRSRKFGQLVFFVESPHYVIEGYEFLHESFAHICEFLLVIFSIENDFNKLFSV